MKTRKSCKLSRKTRDVVLKAMRQTAARLREVAVGTEVHDKTPSRVVALLRKNSDILETVAALFAEECLLGHRNRDSL